MKYELGQYLTYWPQNQPLKRPPKNSYRQNFISRIDVNKTFDFQQRLPYYCFLKNFYRIITIQRGMGTYDAPFPKEKSKKLRPLEQEADLVKLGPLITNAELNKKLEENL